MRRVPTGFAIAAAFLLGAAVVAFGGWIAFLRAPEVAGPRSLPRATHSEYAAAIGELGLAATDLGGAWLEAAEDSIDRALPIEPGFSETATIDPAVPDALIYRFPVTRGRRITVSVTAEHSEFFADVIRLSRDGESEDGVVASIEPGAGARVAGQIVFEARASRSYLVRVQPHLLRGGVFSVTIAEDIALHVPVEGTTAADIWSFFGDRRDGGARVHHGVDIFAPRGTPVLAASDSVVIRVGERDRGGNVVVLRDDARDLLLYYAHLDTQLVREGQAVRAGDAIGTVGNTGNAITTPPHLHLGFYQGSWGRPVDPWPYLVGPDGRVVDLQQADLGSARTATVAVELPQGVSERLGRWNTTATALDARPLPLPASRVRPDPRNRNPFLRAARVPFDGAEGPIDALPGASPALAHATAGALPRIEAGTVVQIVAAGRDHLRLETIDGDRIVVASAAIAALTAGERLESVAVAASEVREVRSGDTLPPSSATEPAYLVGLAGGAANVERLAVTRDGRLVAITSRS